MKLDPSKRWDLLLAIKSPTDLDCLSAFATAEGVEALRGYPNIVVRATKTFAQLPELLAQFPHEFVANGVRNILSGVDTSTTCHEEDISDLFG